MAAFAWPLRCAAHAAAAHQVPRNTRARLPALHLGTNDSFARAGLHGGCGDARKNAVFLFPAAPGLTKSDGRKRSPLRAHTLARRVSMEALHAPPALFDNRIGLGVCARGFQRPGGNFRQAARAKTQLPAATGATVLGTCYKLRQTARNCYNVLQIRENLRQPASFCDFLRLSARVTGERGLWRAAQVLWFPFGMGWRSIRLR